MVIVVRVTNEVDVEVCRRMNGLTTLAPGNDFLELGPCRLDLPTRVFRVRNLLICVDLWKVIVAGENRASFFRLVDTFE